MSETGAEAPQPQPDTAAPELPDDTAQPDAENHEAPVITDEIRDTAKKDAIRLGKVLLARKLTKDPPLQRGETGHLLKGLMGLKNDTLTHSNGEKVMLTNAQDGKEEPVDITTDHSGGEKPIYVTITLNGEQKVVRVLKISGVVNDNGKAMAILENTQDEDAYEIPTGSKPQGTQIVPWDDLIDAQIVAEQQELTAMFTGDDAQFIDYYIATMQDPNKAQALAQEMFSDENIARTRDLLEQEAREANLITRSDIDTYLDSQKSSISADQIEAARQAMGDEVIISGNTLAEIVLMGANLTPDDISTRSTEIPNELSQLSKRLETATTEAQKAQISQQILSLQNEASMLQNWGTVLEANGGQSAHDLIADFGNKIQSGEIPAETAKKITDAIRSGDVKPVIEAVIADAEEKLKDDTSPEAEEKRKKLDALGKLKNGAKGLGLLALLVVVATTLASEKIK